MFLILTEGGDQQPEPSASRWSPKALFHTVRGKPRGTPAFLGLLHHRLEYGVGRPGPEGPCALLLLLGS